MTLIWKHCETCVPVIKIESTTVCLINDLEPRALQEIIFSSLFKNQKNHNNENICSVSTRANCIS